MPAFIHIVSGTSSGERLQLTEEVSRLGSDPGCSLWIDEPSLAALALTIRYKDGQYTVYNRTGGTISVAGRVVESNRNGPWRNGEELRIGDALAMQLLLEGEGRPQPTHAVPLQDYPAPILPPLAATPVPTMRRAKVDPPTSPGSIPAPEEFNPQVIPTPASSPTKKAAPGKKSNPVQALLAAGLFGIAIFVILSDDGFFSSTPAGPKLEWDDVGSKLALSVNSYGEPWAQIAGNLWMRLSEARQLELRGQNERSQAILIHLRDHIEIEKNRLNELFPQETKENTPLETLQLVERYVKSLLEKP
jgi:hypothetical protein